MIEFKRKYSLTNGNRLTRKNWQHVVAKGTEPETGLRGWPEIDRAIRETGGYYCTWKLRKEKEGYIFREINADTGICGHHETYHKAIFAAINPSIRISLEIPEEELS